MKELWKEYKKIIWKRKWMLAILSFVIVVSVVGDIFIYRYYKDLANIFAEDFTENLYSSAFVALFFISIIYALQVVFWRIFDWFIIPFQVGGMRDLSLRTFDVLKKQKYIFFQNEFSGTLLKKGHKFIYNFESITDWFFFNGLTNFLAIFTGFIVFYLEDAYLATVFLCWAIVYLLFSGGAFFWKIKFDKQVTQFDSKVGGLYTDTFSNIFTVKTSGIEEYEKKTIHQGLNYWYDKMKTSWLLSSVIMAIQAILMVAIEIFFIYHLIKKWSLGNFEIGEFILFQTVLLFIFNKIWEFGRSLRNLFVAIADSSEMAEIIKKADIEKDAITAKHYKIKKGAIDFRNISFGYNSKDYLFQDFNLHIQSGESIALVGHSGSGKTTLTNLLFRFFEPQKGGIYFDDILSTDFTYSSLRSQISLVPQMPEMFHRTLRENITLGKEVSDEKIWQALKKSQGYNFVKNLENGLDTLIGERGVKLSGGEKQRIALTRAFIDESQIVILDEATSALDSITESELQKGIFTLISDKTAIVIAHRLSTIMKMDRIIVMEGGKIIEEGTHTQLISQEGKYAQMWKHQRGGFLVD